MTAAPSDLSIRAARADEQRLIRKMIMNARLDPSTLKWPNFLMAEIAGQVVGCVQIKPYRGCRELGSLVVVKEQRGQGIGGSLIEALLARETGDVYLTCHSALLPYYQRFGFVEIGLPEVPCMMLKLKLLSGRILGALLRMEFALMRRQGGSV